MHPLIQPPHTFADPILDAVAQWPLIERARAAIFFDQMIRNAKAIGNVPHGLTEIADAAAVKLAVAVAAEIESFATELGSSSKSENGADDQGSEGSEGGLGVAGATATLKPSPLMTAAEFSFLTLVLRHTRRPDLMQQSLELLRNALNGRLSNIVALTAANSSGAGAGAGADVRAKGGSASAGAADEGSDHDGDNEETDKGRWLLGRFVEETEDSIMGVAAEAYIERALSTDRPTLLNIGTCKSSSQVTPSSLPPVLPPRTEHQMRVLDERCINLAQNNPAGFLPLFNEAAAGGHAAVPAVGPDHPLCAHWVTAALADALTEEGVGPGHTLLLSLSGGVDSMAHAVMLRLLQPAFGYSLCALHIRHPNRDDAVDEEEWVQHAASKIGIELYSYQIQLQRPHGTRKTGISRERYESVTKKIRFRMYEVLAADVGCLDRTAYVVIGHHMDDTDENRLAELGKGNVVNVNGMHTISKCLGMTVYRPLLGLRKAAMIAFANAALLPYMADSTPRWSRRGWTRKVLDECSDEVQGPLLQALDKLGVASERLGLDLDLRLRECGTKVLHGIISEVTGLNKITGDGSVGDEGNGHGIIGDGKVAFVDLGDLESFVAALEPSIQKVLVLVASVADVWNVAVHDQVVAVAAAHAAEGHPGPPPTCPLQPIKLHVDKKFDAGAFLFAMAVKEWLRDGSVTPFLRGAPVAGRALTHLWRSLTQKRKGGACAIWGQMHQSCPIAWPIDRPGILFYPRESYEHVMALEPNGPGRRLFLAECLDALGGQ